LARGRAGQAQVAPFHGSHGTSRRRGRSNGFQIDGIDSQSVKNMLDTLPKWRAAVLVGAITLSTVGCDSHHDADPAQPSRLASAAVAAKSGAAAAVGTDQAVEDSSLTTTVRAAIFADKQLQSQHIKVESEDAAVTLTGVIDSQSLRERAVEIAGSVDGVAQVQDRLRVRD
jgi:hypothetical protein